MEPALDKVYSVIINSVHDTMLLGDSSGPDIRTQILQRLRQTYALEWILHNSVHQVKHTTGNARILPDPVAQVLAELRLKH